MNEEENKKVINWRVVFDTDKLKKYLKEVNDGEVVARAHDLMNEELFIIKRFENEDKVKEHNLKMNSNKVKSFFKDEQKK